MVSSTSSPLSSESSSEPASESSSGSFAFVTGIFSARAALFVFFKAAVSLLFAFAGFAAADFFGAGLRPGAILQFRFFYNIVSMCVYADKVGRYRVIT
ncbi:hypothetical protein BX070DRAFT_224486 [Coemansia spiralis]|nr:hypothetical protein BX070DRAFT_224486 [Coemansia spiralis]